MIEMLKRSDLNEEQKKAYDKLKKEQNVADSDDESSSSDDDTYEYKPLKIIPVNPWKKPETKKPTKPSKTAVKRRKRKNRLPPHVVPVMSLNPNMCGCSHPAPYPVTRPKPKPGINPFVTHHAPPKEVKYKKPKYQAPKAYYAAPEIMPPSVFALESIWSKAVTGKSSHITIIY